ncbi:MAG: ABC transporter permease subunit [Gemmatimonadetes bacterium]|jgi:hypothetical protein|nr:ABC transporter permease subunit [Gemmatimonadota bacterium]MBT6144407.1 ABC transporter permease subunit [Gemmatimonadota bacterium]MBT7864192.1 ABC transporter permease subunit [Gemmatimonadota bacterium]
MKALLWKEARENLYKVATGLGVVLLLLVLRQLESFNKGFIIDADAWAGVIGALCAGVLAMEVLAGERSRGTLEFLLVRPTTVGRILAAKFLVGALGLFAVMAAYWAMVYAVPPGPVPIRQFASVQLLLDVPWLAMVYAWYLPMLALYAIVFAASAATDNAGEAIGAAGLIGLFLVLLLALSVTLIPGCRERFPVPFDFVEVLGNEEYRLLATLDPMTILHNTLIVAAFVAVGFMAAHTVLTRARNFVISRKILVICAFALGTMMLTLTQIRPDRTLPIHPTHSIQLAKASNLSIAHGRVYAFQVADLVVFDIDGEGRPIEIGRASHAEGGTLHQLQVLGNRVCGLTRGDVQGQNRALVCFDVDDPSAPLATGALAIPESGRIGDEVGYYYGSSRPGPLVQTVGDVLIIAIVEDARSILTSVEVSDGSPTPIDSLVIEEYEYADKTWHDGYSYGRDELLPRHAINMAAGDQHLFLGWHKGLRVVEVTEDGALRPVADLDTGDGVARQSGTRHIRRRGDTLFVDRLWPRQLLEVDISSPTAPRIVATHRPRARRTRDIVGDYYVYRMPNGIKLHAVEDPYPFPTPLLTLPIESDRWWTKDVEYHDGRAYALMDDQLAVFDMPDRQ